MSYCVTPGCFQPQNPDNSKFCFSCGSLLLLKDRYRPIQPIGKGGFGRAFLAVDEGAPRKTRCVVKQLYLDSNNTLIVKKATELFNQEAVRLQELGNHPQIPALFAHFEQQKRLYLVQEFINGQTLSQELKQKISYNEDEIWDVLRDLLPVLKFVHDRKVLHRDIKPANIMRRRTPATAPSQLPEKQKSVSVGEKANLVLIDFGVAKQLTDSALFKTGTAVGSPEYMPPEQTKGKALPASDLYSLGVTCVELLTGVPPLQMYDAMNNRWAWRDFITNDKQVSDRLARILDKLLKTSVSQRYQSAGEVLQAIHQPALPPRLQTQPNKPTPDNSPINFFTKLFNPQAGKPLSGKIVSETGIDYTNLDYLLASGKWEQADKETWSVMCETLNKSPSSYIQTSDIDKLPCEDLEIINQLWVKYSKSRFGFSVQKQIFESVEQDYGQFCLQVGWPPQEARTPYLKFNLSAPIGHLPSRNWAGGYQWWRHAAVMASKLDKCQI